MTPASQSRKPFSIGPEIDKLPRPTQAELARGLGVVPREWSLTPVLDNKRPYRADWQSEEKIGRDVLIGFIERGDRRWSERKQRHWTAWPKGYGLRLGDGLLALDFDGESAEAQAQKLSGGDLPETVAWTSGKPGRHQRLYRVSPELHARLVEIGFTHLETSEKLDFRYTRCQSVLPPSSHPDTGRYRWLQSPKGIEVVAAPGWVERYLFEHCDRAEAEKAAQARRQQAREAAKRQLGELGQTSLVDLVEATGQKLGADGFDAPVHDWRWQGGKKARGGCPWHESASGSAGWLAPTGQDGGWRYHCPVCTNDKGLNHFAYWLALRNGPDAAFPRGRSWAEAAKQYLGEYGVVIPERSANARSRFDVIQDLQNLQTIRGERQKELEIAQMLEETRQRVKAQQLRQARQREGQKAAQQRATGRSAPQVGQQVSQARPASSLEIVLYDPNFSKQCAVVDVTPETIPSVDEWEAMGRPRYLYKRGDRARVWQRMVALGYKHVLDSSVTGEGKSHSTGAFLEDWIDLRWLLEEAEDEGQRNKPRAWYVTDNPRNPTTETLEKVTEKASASAEMLDRSRTTPLGNPYRRRAKTGETPDLEAMCSEDGVIQGLRTKGLNVQRGRKADYCNKICPHKAKCPFLELSDGQREEHALRVHPARLQPSGQDVAVVDEAGRTIEISRVTAVTGKQVERELDRLARECPDIYFKFRKVFEALSKGLRRAIDERCEQHGLDHLHLLRFLPSASQVSQLILEGVGDTVDLWDAPSVEELADKVVAATLPDLGELLAGTESADERIRAVNEGMVSGVVPKLLRAIAGEQVKLLSLQISPLGKLVMTQRSRTGSTLRKLRTVIYLDATPTPKKLSQVTGIDQRDFCKIESYRPRFSNVNLNTMDGFGNATARRDNHNKEGQVIESAYAQTERAKNAVKAIHARREGNTGVLDYKAYLEGYEGEGVVTGACFRDNRGSNAFMKCTQIVSVPRPTPNLGAKVAEWQLLTGQIITLDKNEKREDHKAPQAFWDWIEEEQTNELIQDVGRARAQHRPDEQIDHWFLSATPKQVRAVQAYYVGSTVTQHHVSHVAPTAAPKGTQRRHGVVQAMWEAVERGERLDRRAIALRLGVTPSRVSQLVAPHGGLKVLRKRLVLLLEALKSKTNLSVNPVLVTLSQEYLPDVARRIREKQELVEPLEEFEGLLEAFKDAPEGLDELLKGTPKSAIATIMGGYLELASFYERPDTQKDPLESDQIPICA